MDWAAADSILKKTRAECGKLSNGLQGGGQGSGIAYNQLPRKKGS